MDKQNDHIARRTICAIRRIVTGLGHVSPEQAGVLFLAGEPLTRHDQIDAMRRAAIHHDADFVHVGFPGGIAPGRHGLITVGVPLSGRGREYAVHYNCLVWAPASGGNCLLVPVGELTHGCFGHDGERLVHLPTRPDADLAPGISRAEGRLLTTMDEVSMSEIQGARDVRVSALAG